MHIVLLTWWWSLNKGLSIIKPSFLNHFKTRLMIGSWSLMLGAIFRFLFFNCLNFFYLLLFFSVFHHNCLTCSKNNLPYPPHCIIWWHMIHTSSRELPLTLHLGPQMHLHHVAQPASTVRRSDFFCRAWPGVATCLFTWGCYPHSHTRDMLDGTSNKKIWR